MSWLFNLIYLAVLAIAWPWLLVASWRKGKYREGWSQKLFGLVPRRDSQRPCIWLHAVSLGEVNLLETLLARIERDYPQWDVVISTTTASGFAQAKKRYAPRTVFYAPLDFTWAVSQSLRRIRPDVLLLAELELWPNLVRAASSRGIRMGVINGRLSDRSFRGYRRLQLLFKSTFARVNLVAAQSDEYTERFRALGSPHVVSTGSLKFDGAQSDRSNPATQRLASSAGISSDDVVFLAGSTQAPEESLALDAFCSLAEQFLTLKLVLVPRHPERFEEVAQLLDRQGVPWQRRTELSAAGFSPAKQSRILLVDAVGELKDWWGLATVGFVGGSMGSRGGQNMIEPAAYGVAVCFGPNTWNFRDVVALFLQSDAAEVVTTGEQLTDFVRRCLIEPTYAENIGQRAADLVASQQGAAERTMALLRPLFQPSTDAQTQRRLSVRQRTARPLTTSTSFAAPHSPPTRSGTRPDRD